MPVNNNQYISYGFSQPLVGQNPRTIIGKRAPIATDLKPLGTLWIDTVTNATYILTSIVGNIPTWSDITGAAGSFASLTVTPGPIALAGTTTINTLGASSTFIGSTPGTGVVNIGNTTGNTVVTGNMTVSGSITSTAGNITATDGNVVLSTAATQIVLPGPVHIMTGAGAPAGGLALAIGDTYYNTTAASATTRMYIATAVGTWTNVTCAA